MTQPRAAHPPNGDMPSRSHITPERPVIVVKIGTSSIMREAHAPSSLTVAAEAAKQLPSDYGELAISTMGLLVDSLLTLRRDGFDVILVSSGAVGVGCRELNIAQRPVVTSEASKEDRARVLAETQAYAAVGQSVLVRMYDSLFAMANQKTAQVLLTSSDLGNEYQYYNAKNTLCALLNMGVIPIINENDTVATEEIKYGDNDWLSALVSSTMSARWLFLLTDIDQLYSANPRVDPTAQPINLVSNIESLAVNLSSNATGTQWGTGGMKTKITAARLATAAGVRVCLVHGRHPSRIIDFVRDHKQRVGTVFEPLSRPLEFDRMKWIANCLPPRGSVIISEAAATLVRAGFPVRALGVADVQGMFESNSAVCILSVEGTDLARGICNYSSEDLSQFKGMRGDEIASETGIPMNEKVIHADNIALLVDNDEDSVSPQLIREQMATTPPV